MVPEKFLTSSNILLRLESELSLPFTWPLIIATDDAWSL